MAAPKQTDPQFKLRLTPELKEKIQLAASGNKRTMNAEILARLEASFGATIHVPTVHAGIVKSLSGSVAGSSEISGNMSVRRAKPKHASGSATVTGVGEASADYQIVPSSELQEMREEMARMGEAIGKLAERLPEATTEDIFEEIRKVKAGKKPKDSD